MNCVRDMVISSEFLNISSYTSNATQIFLKMGGGGTSFYKIA